MLGLNWLLRRLQNRGRRIFKYWDGSRQRACDPMVAARLLDAHEKFDWETTPKFIDVEDAKLSDESMGITADAVRMAFGIPIYDGSRGLTEAELVNLLIDFVTYLNELKKNIREPLTSPPNTESESSDESTTKSESPCGSTSTASESPEPSVH